MLGKHASGPFQGKWGFASLSAELDRRPQECAAKLAEVCTLGIKGRASSLVQKCKKLGKTVNGLQVYCLEVEESLDESLNGCTQYLLRCFALGNLPPGVCAWSKCKFYDIADIKKSLDQYSRDTLQFLQL